MASLCLLEQLQRIKSVQFQDVRLHQRLGVRSQHGDIALVLHQPRAEELLAQDQPQADLCRVSTMSHELFQLLALDIWVSASQREAAYCCSKSTDTQAEHL